MFSNWGIFCKLGNLGTGSNVASYVQLVINTLLFILLQLTLNNNLRPGFFLLIMHIVNRFENKYHVFNLKYFFYFYI